MLIPNEIIDIELEKSIIRQGKSPSELCVTFEGHLATNCHDILMKIKEELEINTIHHCKKTHIARICYPLSVLARTYIEHTSKLATKP